MSYILSKSSYIKGLQCIKQLYLYKHHYNWRDPISKEQQLIFDRGHEVGNLAQQLFPGGIDVSPASPKFYKQSLQKTQELLKLEQMVIYEAAFVGLSTLVYCDILVKTPTGIRVYEVKSSLKLSKTYYQDAALQYAVLKDAGLNIESFYLINFNSDYRLGDALDLNQLFKITEVTEYCKENYLKIEEEIKEMVSLLQQNKIPEVVVGPHCNQPYACDFKGYCWKEIPQDSIYRLSGVPAELFTEWLNSGVKLISEIKEVENLPEPLKSTIKAKQLSKVLIDHEKIKTFITEIKSPITFFDIESIMPAVPKYKGTSPFHNLPVMFSVLTVLEDGTKKENFWMHDVDADPRKNFIENFIKFLPKEGSLVVFDKTSEWNILNKVLEEFPEYNSVFGEFRNRVIDISVPFTNRWYYHPEFNGGSSLKLISSLILTHNPFLELEINSGGIAMHAYQKMLNSNDMFEKAELADKLQNYSLADVHALYEIFKLLKSL